MLAVTHIITSAAIGAQVSSTPFAFSLAFLFHLFLDTLLHWNIYIDKHRWPYFWVVVDVLGGLLATYWLTSEQFFSTPMLAAVLGGNLPDITAGISDLLKRSKGGFLRFHEGIQNETSSPWKGLRWQVALVALSVWTISSRG